MPPMISQAIVEIEKKVEQPTKLTEIPEAANESDHESDSAIVRSKENLLSEIFEKHD
jgi:histidine ammonia-lyase